MFYVFRKSGPLAVAALRALACAALSLAISLQVDAAKATPIKEMAQAYGFVCAQERSLQCSIHLSGTNPHNESPLLKR